MREMTEGQSRSITPTWPQSRTQGAQWERAMADKETERCARHGTVYCSICFPSKTEKKEAEKP